MRKQSLFVAARLSACLVFLATASPGQSTIGIDRGIPSAPRHEQDPTAFSRPAFADGQQQGVQTTIHTDRDTTMEIQHYDPESVDLIWTNPQRVTVSGGLNHTFTGTVEVERTGEYPDQYAWTSKFYGILLGGGGGGGISDWSFPAQLDMIALIQRVDSNNDGDIDEDDESIKNDPSKPGKIIACNTGMTANDKPGFADFAATASAFAEMTLDIKTATGTIDWENATIQFEYSGSDPDLEAMTKQTQEGITYYEPEAGNLRIWTKSGNQTRSPNSVADSGDYVPPDTDLDAEAIFGQGGSANVTLYIEGIRPGPFPISVTFRPTTDPNVTADQVRVTLFDLSIDIDANNDGVVNASDRLFYSMKPGKIIWADKDRYFRNQELVTTYAEIVLHAEGLNQRQVPDGYYVLLEWREGGVCPDDLNLFENPNGTNPILPSYHHPDLGYIDTGVAFAPGETIPERVYAGASASRIIGGQGEGRFTTAWENSVSLVLHEFYGEQGGPEVFRETRHIYVANSPAVTPTGREVIAWLEDFSWNDGEDIVDTIRDAVHEGENHSNPYAQPVIRKSSTASPQDFIDVRGGSIIFALMHGKPAVTWPAIFPPDCDGLDMAQHWVDTLASPHVVRLEVYDYDITPPVQTGWGRSNSR